MKSVSQLILFLCLSVVGNLMAQQPLLFSPWTKGNLDIHHITTGRGVSSFFVMPDGTTLLIDAGATERPRDARLADAVPDDSRTPGEWISRYVARSHPDQLHPSLDYLLLTHFDTDHMGGLYEGLATSDSYQLTGVTEVATRLKTKRIIDRAWPDYNWPAQLKKSHMANYQKFLKWYTTEYKGKVEQIRPGYSDQVVLAKNPNRYPNFKVQNIAANCRVWTGKGSETATKVPDLKSLAVEELPTENMSSIALKITYGKFDYFIGGDLTGVPMGDWQDMETPVADVVGPVDVNVVNHHGYFDAQNDYFLRKLQPKVHIIQSWAVSHPSPGTLSRLQSTKLYPGSRDIFSTNTMGVTKTFIGGAINGMKSLQGHIVVRVHPGGATYTIYVLDDSNEKNSVKSIHGPYTSN